MNNINDLSQQLAVIQKDLAELKILKKEVLNFEEACQHLSISSSHLYKLTSIRQVPCYQPNGKKLYFKRSELDEWLLRSRKSASDEIERLATDYILSTSKRKGGVV